VPRIPCCRNSEFDLRPTATEAGPPGPHRDRPSCPGASQGSATSQARPSSVRSRPAGPDGNFGHCYAGRAGSPARQRLHARDSESAIPRQTAGSPILTVSHAARHARRSSGCRQRPDSVSHGATVARPDGHAARARHGRVSRVPARCQSRSDSRPRARRVCQPHRHQKHTVQRLALAGPSRVRPGASLNSESPGIPGTPRQAPTRLSLRS